MCNCMEKGNDWSGSWLGGCQRWIMQLEGPGPEYTLPCTQEGLWSPDSLESDFPSSSERERLPPGVTAGPATSIPQSLASP